MTDTDARRREIKQSFSLASVDGSALTQLRQTGSCTFGLPRTLYEVPFPHLHARLIQRVYVSIIALVGPSATLSVSLTLLKSFVETEDLSGLAERGEAQNMVVLLSGAGQVAGILELGCQDERFFPLEGEGVVSDWRMEFGEAEGFDCEAIADVVIHMEYTALDSRW